MKRLIFLFIFLPWQLFAQYQSFRDSIDVIKYNINLNVSVKEKKISGYTIVNFKPLYPNMHTIRLDLLKLKVYKIFFNGKVISRWSQNDSLIIIDLPMDIDTSHNYSLKIFYGGKPVQDKFWGGFYFKNNNAFNMGVGMTSIPHSFGRVWFPCNDKFSDKALFEYHITVKKPYTAVCGGKLIEKKQLRNKRVFVYKLNKPIPAYLASVNVGVFDTITGIYNGITKKIPYRIFVFKGKKQLAKKTFVHILDALSIFEKLFGAYPWDLVGYSEINFTGGAMEHVENISMPFIVIDGTLKNEALLYHELSHSWFGDLVTCKTAKDIWLNEGWASYAEILFFENLYGQDKAKEQLRKKHFYALNFAHRNDHGYRAIANMNLKFTYGTTIYKKSPSVIHTLRYYMGDSLFFATVKAYLKKFAFKNVSTAQMQQFFSTYSKKDLTDFFNLWIYSKGFPYFELKNWKIIDSSKYGYQILLTIVQRKLGDTLVGKNVKLPVFFYDRTFKPLEKDIFVSGEKTTLKLRVPFKPRYVALDINEQIADATTDRYYIVRDTGTYIFDYELSDVVITSIGHSDSALIRVQANWLPPDNVKKYKGYLFQKNYYWTVGGIFPKTMKGKLKLYLTTLMDINFVNLHNPKEFLLFYRSKPTSAWKRVNFRLVKSNYLETDLKPGDYAIAIKTYE